MFLEEIIYPSEKRMSLTPRTPIEFPDNFGYSQSPLARVEILKLRERLEECRNKLKECENKKGRSKKKGKTKRAVKKR